MRIFYSQLVITIAVLCGLATTASAECPLKAGTVTTWTIDSVNPTNTNTACQDNQNGDCSLFGVIDKMNKVIPVECGTELKAQTLNGATLVLKFLGPLFKPVPSVDVTVGLTINFYPGVKLVIDGDLGDGKRFQFRKTNKYQTVLDVSCKSINAAGELKQCDQTITTAGLELRNVSFEKGNTAIRVLSGIGTTFPNITMEKIDCLNQAETGLMFINLKAEDLKVTDVTVENLVSELPSNGLAFNSVNLVKGDLQHVAVARNGKSVNAIGINFYNKSSIAQLTIDDAAINGVGKALQFVLTKDGYKNVTITNSVLGTPEHPVISFPIVFESKGDLLKITNVQSVGGGAAGVFLNASSPTDALTNVQILHSRFAQATHGIWIQGNVQQVTVEDVALYDMTANGIYVKATSNIPEPQKISYGETHFRNVATPVKYESLVLNAYTDGVYETPGPANSINLGIDTPTGVKVFRDSKKPQWFQVEFIHSEKIQAATFFWVHEGHWYPMKLDGEKSVKEKCQGGLCTFRWESQFDAAHFVPPPALAGVPAEPAPYAGQSLEDLTVAVMVVADSNASMVSAPLSLLNPNWIDQEILTVDTTVDALTDGNGMSLQVCTTKAGDCSLRGAIALAKKKRVAPLNLTHPFVVRFAKELVSIPLASALTIDVNDIKLEGPIQIVPNVDGIKELVIMANNQQILDHLELDGQGKVVTAVKSTKVANLITGSTVKNTTGDAIRVEQATPVAGQPVPHLQVFDSTLGLFGGKGVSMAKDNLVQVSKIRLAKTTPAVSPSFLVSGAAVAPTFIQSTELVYPTPLSNQPMTLKVYGEIANMITGLQGYLRLPTNSQWELVPITTTELLTFPGTKTFKAIFSLPDNLTPSDLLQSKSMTLYMMGELTKSGELVTTNLSNGADLDFSKSDYDEDGVMDNIDNAPTAANPDQKDSDGDKIGDAVDPDLDGDGKDNSLDNCLAVMNADQTDTDGDGLGDACDDDDDDDGTPDGADSCPYDPYFDFVNGVCIKDLDKDGVRDDIDNCPGLFNDDQLNSDGEGQGDTCDADDDNDGVSDGDDNCPLLANEGQTDTDSDTQGDSCDEDDDGDGIADVTDNCALLGNADQGNTDDDTFGDLCDPDDDNDGVEDAKDNCPLDMNAAQTDADSDSVGDACDPDTPVPQIIPLTEPKTEPKIVDEQLQVDGAVPLPSGSDEPNANADDAEKPVVAPADSPPSPEPVANAESGGCTLMMRR